MSLILTPPASDPTSIFNAVRGNYQTEILTAGVVQFGIFQRLETGPMTFEALAEAVGLKRRPAHVLLTGLAAMGLLVRRVEGRTARYALSPLGREHLIPGSPTYVGDYVSMGAQTPGVIQFVDRLRSDRATPDRAGADDDKGAAYTFRQGEASAMDDEAMSRKLTLNLAGRAKNVAPVLAERYSLAARKRLLDIGGGTGIYSFALLQRNPGLRAIIWDRAQVLRVAKEMADQYGVADRCEFMPGDMFTDPVPPNCDVMLLSNILHDWDEPQCATLVERCAQALPMGGSLLIHDAFLADNLDGPLSVALYSAALFCVTEGRCYSGAEYAAWLTAAGLAVRPAVPTLVNCSVLPGEKA